MNAPVAANRLNLPLTTKNTISGPSSVASLNSGCGWVLSIIQSIESRLPPSFETALRASSGRGLPVSLPHPEERALARVSKDESLDARDRLRKIPRGERREIVD